MLTPTPARTVVKRFRWSNKTGLQPLCDAFAVVQSDVEFAALVILGQHDAGKVDVLSVFTQSSGPLIPQHFI